MEQIQIGGYVRILKNGQFENKLYNKDEIWQIYSVTHGKRYPDVERKGKRVRICLDEKEPRYGQEAEYIGMSIPEETYNIY